MSVYSSMQRSQPNLNALTGLIKNYFQKRRDDENRQAIQDRFNPSVTRAKMGDPLETEATNGPGAPAAAAPTMERPRTAADLVSGAQAPSPISLDRFQGTETVKQPRGINSVDDIYWLGDQLKQDPAKIQESAQAFLAGQRPQLHFGAGGEVFSSDPSGNVRKLFGREFPPPRTAAATKEPGKKFSRVVGRDGFYYDAVEDPESGEVKYTRSKIQAPEKKGMDDEETDGSGGTGGSGTGKGFKRSAVLKTLQQKKDALEAQIKRLYPTVDLDKAIVYGIDTGKDDELHSMLKDYTQAIEEYQARANIEGEEFTPAFDVAQHNLSNRGTDQAQPARSGSSANPALPPKLAGETKQHYIERLKKNGFSISTE